MEYFKYTQKSRHDKAVNTLLGLLEGVAADKEMNPEEKRLLDQWIEDNGVFADRHPYNEFVPVMRQALEDGVLSDSEHNDLTWLCRQFISTQYYDDVSAEIQQLHAILAAVSADGKITEAEVETIMDWMGEHEHLKRCFPYDEIESVLTSVMKDRHIDPEEHKALLEFFLSFSPSGQYLQSPETRISTVTGICAVAPEIVFDQRRFCFTGEASRMTREEMKIVTLDRGGLVLSDVSPRLDYLVVGSQGNPCWVYACYGRKIEKAMQLRQKGSRITIVHEVDFLDAVS